MPLNNAEQYPPLLNIEDLARLINRKSTTILVDRVRRPESLPPDCTPPLQKSPVWALSVVLEWYATFQKPVLPMPKATGRAVKRRGAPTKAERIAKKLQKVDGGRDE